MRSVLTSLILVALIAGVSACDAPARTPRPSPSLIILDFSPRPSGSAAASASPGASHGGWPVGWDVSFCAMFVQAVDAQQLLVDVERALDEGANRDARLLADELIQSASAGVDAVAEVPTWADATATVVAIAGLMDLGKRAGTEYHAWFANDKKAALRRARVLRLENGAQVPAANDGLADLANAGLTCQDVPLVLEAPG
jgi:hypothetical protein